MGRRLDFSEENIKKNPFDYPKLKLAKGETARLTVVESPVVEYVHTIQKPILDEAGQVVYQTKERKDGTEYQVPKLTFVSNPICLGDEEVLDTDGIDPKNCPVCERAANGERGFYPKRRFAMHVIRTNTKPGTFEPNGTGYQLVVWAFTDVIYGKLVSIGKEFPLSQNDLKLGPCEDAVFQKADLSNANGTVVDEETRKLIYNDSTVAEKLEIFCGQKKSIDRINEDLAQVDAQWARAEGNEESESVTQVADLGSGISALLEDDAPAKQEAPAPAKEEAPAAAPAAEDKPKPATDFDDLFAGL